jgi:hypothetical protein
MGELEACFGRLDTFFISAEDRCTFAPNVLWARKSFWPHPRDLLGDMGQIEAHFGPFGDSVNLDAR